MKSESCPALVVGTANTEIILPQISKLVPGTKTRCTTQAFGLGGSALNWALRLRSAGMEVTACCPLGRDDGGRRIDTAFSELDIKSLYVDSDNDATTTQSYVFVANGERTIITHTGTAVNDWAASLERMLKTVLDGLKDRSLVAMIGNNPVDTAALDYTPRVISLIKDRECQGKRTTLFANFGSGQYSHCYHTWHAVWPKIDFFQLSLDEAVVFVDKSLDCEQCKLLLPDTAQYAPRRRQPFGRVSLSTILRWFVDAKTSAIVTVGRCGAVAVFRDDPGAFYFAWPRPVDSEFVDPTGAGDAFGAGFVYYLTGGHEENKRQKDLEYRRAMGVGTLFGSAACEDFGGSANILDRETLLHRVLRDTTQPQEYCQRQAFENGAGLLYVIDRT
jgi:sugar/nucleoside kinase (ribokinase family)